MENSEPQPAKKKRAAKPKGPALLAEGVVENAHVLELPASCNCNAHYLPHNHTDEGIEQA